MKVQWQVSAKLSTANLEKAKLVRATLAGAIATSANFTRVEGHRASFVRFSAARTSFTSAELQRGADIEVRNKGGLTALHAAAYGGHLDVIELLVSKGAAVNDQKNFYHMSPLHAAAEEGHADAVAFLLANGAEVEAAEEIEANAENKRNQTRAGAALRCRPFVFRSCIQTPSLTDVALPTPCFSIQPAAP